MRKNGLWRFPQFMALASSPLSTHPPPPIQGLANFISGRSENVKLKMSFKLKWQLINDVSALDYTKKNYD